MTSIPPVNFAAAVTLGDDYDGDYTKIDLSRGSTAKGSPQIARFFVTGAHTTGTTAGTLHLVLRDHSGNVIYTDTATITPTAVVASTGRVVADVSFAKSSSDKIDLLGMHTKGLGAQWWFAVTALGDFDSNVEVGVAISNEL